MAMIAFGFRADEDDALLLQRLAEGGAFGQKPVAGMHGFRTGRLAGGDDLLRHEIAFGGRRRPDMHRLVGHLDMHGVAIGVRIDRDGGDPHLARRLDDAAGDLATIGNQDFFEHGRRFLRLVFPYYGVPAACSSGAACKAAIRISHRELLVHWRMGRGLIGLSKAENVPPGPLN